MWSEGIIACPTTGNKFKYWVKHYTADSEHGINGGKVSKLTIRKVGETRDLYNYDRGLDRDCATDEVRTVLDIILDKYKEENE
jgi:hypothetical protein